MNNDLDSFRQQMLNNVGQTGGNTPPVSPGNNQSVQRLSPTEQMRARMREGSTNTASTVMEQGATYNPTSTTTVQETAKSEPTKPSTPAGSTSTTINTTRTPKKDKDGSNKKNFVLAVAGVALVLVILFVAVLGGKGKNPKPTDISTEDTSTSEEFIYIEQSTPAFSYTFEEIEALRECGYTGYEIDTFQLEQVSAQSKIDEATAKRDAWVQEAIAPLYDTASDEYKHFISQTWLSLEERTNLDTWGRVAGYYEVRKNLDYEKVDPYGHQLFIKIYLDDDAHQDWFFMLVTPEDWNKLKDKGNVVCTYRYATKSVFDGAAYTEDKTDKIITYSKLEIIE